MTMPKNTDLRTRLVWGAFIADAAALGLHWIYAQPRIRRAGGDAPEFTEPDSANYEGVPSYFAHAGKHAGDLSMYGETALVMLRSVEENGSADAQHYARAFHEHFGFGGQYVGYIDSPTRETLTNQIRHGDELLAAALELPYEGSDKKKRSITEKVLANAQLQRGDALREKVHETITLTKGGDAEHALAEAVIGLFESRRRYPGSTTDAQLPALSTLPVLLAAFPDLSGESHEFEEMVRVTHNNDEALSWARFAFEIVQRLARDGESGATLEEAITAATASAPPFIAEEIETVFKQRATDNKVYTMKHGPACELKAGIPAVLHNLLGARDFSDAVRRNILASGDSCGRAMFLGPAAAALFGDDPSTGIPAEWYFRLSRYEELARRIGAVVR